MSAGLQVYTSDGFLQLDDQSINFGLRYKYSYLVGANTPTTFTFAAYSPLVAYYAVGGYGVKLSQFKFVNNNNGTFTLTFSLAGTYYGGNNLTFEIYIFDLMTQLDNSGKNYGLEVFNPQGQLVYSTAFKPLRMLFYSQTASPGPTNPYTGGGGTNGQMYGGDLHPEWSVAFPASIPANRKCAVIYTATRYGYQDDGGDAEGIFEVLNINGRDVKLTYQYDGSSGGSGGGVATYLATIYPPQIWVIDVTNY